MASAVFRACSVLLLVLYSTYVHAQPSVNASRLYLGTSGSTCVEHSGTGVPSSSLGAVCDIYLRKDSPYSIYVKTGASTWSAVVNLPGSTSLTTVGALDTGSITSGFGAINVGADGITGATLTGTTSVSTPTLTNSSNLTLSPTGDVIFDPAGNDLLPGTGYTKNIGALTNKYLQLHVAELVAETLVAQETIATIGGRLLVGPTTVLTSDLAAAGTSITVKHNEIANGDRLVMQALGKYERFLVTSGASGSGPYTYTVTRNTDGSGANDWTAGDAVFNTGTTGDGFIDLYSVNGIIPGSTAGPTIVGNVRTNTGDTDIAPRWAIGNLNGLYGYSSTTYGAAFGDPSAAWVKIDPTNGVRLGHNATTSVQINASGDASFATGAISLSPSGITIAPPTTGTSDSTRAYAFTVASGEMRMDAYRDSGDTTRVLRLSNQSNSAGATDTSINLATSTGATGVVANMDVTTSSALTRFFLNASNNTNTMTISGSATDNALNFTSSGTMLFTASTYTDLGNDLRIYQNNSSTAAMPYMRSNGNYLSIEPRSNANGGFLALGGDQVTDVYLTQGGGTTRIYTALVLNGLASCTLQVNGSGAVGCVSDAAAKRDIKSWSPGLSTVNRLRPVSYRWAEGADTDRHIGFIAQDVDKVIPEAVTRQEWGKMLTLDDRAILAALVNAVQELSRKVKP